MVEINLNDTDIMAGEESAAQRNAELFEKAGVRAFNVMGATGSGKTTLVEAISTHLGPDISVGAIAGDVKGKTDYERLKKKEMEAVNLNTESKCHLDAQLVSDSLSSLSLEDLDLLFVENVGNLICPANFPLGTEQDIVIVSVTEGEDMVVKQPKMFLQSDLLIINKIDLADAVGVDPDRPKQDYLDIRPDGRVILTDLKREKGVDEVINYLELSGTNGRS